MTPNQEFALAQLRRMSALSAGAVAVEDITEVDEHVLVTIRLALGALPYATGGIKVEPTETFVVSVGADFPDTIPVVFVTHRRWEGSPHVQYRGQLCLYLAPSLEWEPAEGMHGQIGRASCRERV